LKTFFERLWGSLDIYQQGRQINEYFEEKE